MVFLIFLYTNPHSHFLSVINQLDAQTYCKTKRLCIKLVNYLDKYTEMHSQQNVKKKYILMSSTLIQAIMILTFSESTRCEYWPRQVSSLVRISWFSSLFSIKLQNSSYFVLHKEHFLRILCIMLFRITNPFDDIKACS